SETGAETHTESPLPRITAPPDQVLPQKGEETSSIQESASETFTGPKLVTEQVTTDPLAQERPDPPLRSIDKRSRLENSLSVVSVIVAILTLMAIAIQAWIYDQQRTIMSTQVENTQKNIQITERAYIGVASLKADLDHGEVVVMLENIGRKPAKAITMKADAYHINAVKLKKGAKTNFNSGEVRLFPGSFKMRVVVPLPECDPQEIRAISENRQFLYVDGIIQYDDGFGFTDSTTFAFKYIPPPREGWEAVDTPLAHLEEKLTSEVFKLSQDGDITIVSPAFDRSRRLSPPAYIPSPSVPSPSGSSPPGQSPSVPSPPGPTALGPSPLASATKTSTPALTNERDTGCKCTCRQTCGGCTYTCTGCGLVEAAELSARCCENAISPPCPDDPK
ncbi:MAG TPA: hypothetical protein VN843_23140, partial [Anaerolineales bacterium]|nr:hypothetical protein [Anaerolineales bacterium]